MAESVELTTGGLGNLAKSVGNLSDKMGKLDAEQQKVAKSAKSVVAAHAQQIQTINAIRAFISATSGKPQGTITTPILPPIPGSVSGPLPIIPPPIIPPPRIVRPPAASGPGTNWLGITSGLTMGAFSPWIGARVLSNALPGIGSFFGAGGGGSAIFGASGIGGFGAAFIALQLATKALSAAFHELLNAVERGKDLYVASARAGAGTGQLAHLQAALQASGLPAGMAEKLLEQGQFGRGNKFSIEGALAGASGGMGQKDMQMIRNLSDDIKRAWNDTEMAAMRSSNQATALFDLSGSFSKLKYEIDIFVGDIVQAMKPWIEIIIAFMRNQVSIWDSLLMIPRMVNAELANTTKGFLLLFAVIQQKLHDLSYGAIAAPDMAAFARRAASIDRFFGLDSEKSDLRFGGPPRNQSSSQWERMGLLINGGMGGTDFARQTARNTARTAYAVEVLANQWHGGTPRGSQLVNAP